MNVAAAKIIAEKISIEAAKPLVGGIVRVDKADLLDDDVIETILAALEDRGVLVFPEIGLSDHEQLALTDRLGPRVNFTKSIPGGSDGSDVYKVTLDADVNNQPEYVQGTFFWHIDGVTMDIPLPKATLLTARKLSDTGGQTEFANLYAAYEALPDTEKDEIEGLRVVHNMAASMRPMFDINESAGSVVPAAACLMDHPVVWTHKSGRKSLIVGMHADQVIGQPLPDGRARLVRLMEWAGQQQFTYRHHWKAGDLVLWDNHGLMHRVIPYDAKSGRTMHRTTIDGEGEKPGRVWAG